MKELQTRGNNSNGDEKSSNKPPKINWQEHANAQYDFSRQNKFLSANFLFCLPTQKLQLGEAMDARSMVCHVQDFSVQVEKHSFWNVKYGMLGSYFPLFQPTVEFQKLYKSGKTLPLSKRVYATSSRATQQLSSDSKSKFADSIRMNQSLSESHTQTSKVEEDRHVMMQSGSYSMSDRFQLKTNNGAARKSASYTRATVGSKSTYSEGIIDDHVLESSSTPQPTISKLPPFAYAILEEKNLPPELCLNCSHIIKLALCSEASNHLQEMKDSLINISNDLIDNIDEMSSEKVEKLRLQSSQLSFVQGYFGHFTPCFSHSRPINAPSTGKYTCSLSKCQHGLV